jgi:enediyne biosynthesis protein E4
MFFLIAWIAALAVGSAAIYETLPPSRTRITFSHASGLSERRRLPESIAPGVAILDYNGDGRMDLFFVNSAGPHALYRNEGNLKFTDVTKSAGVGGRYFGLGVTTCDYNKDGSPDLFVTAHGRNTLYKNNSDGTFTDVTREAGLDQKGLWTAAVFFDADNDGDEDLFLGHFVDYNAASEPACVYGGRYHYCHPLSYAPFPSKLYRNNGDGVFTDISESSGIALHRGKVFGAVATDINNDGLLDLFVANDSVPNFLFVNRGALKFDEVGLDAGVAYSADGNPRSGMGVDAADFNNDGLQDLFVGNFNRERFSIYRNRGKLIFSDEAGPTGIGTATQMYSGWGVRFFDMDHDGDEDFIICNSHPDDQIEKLSSTLTFREPILLFENTDSKFTLVNHRAGEAFQKNWPARGLAVGDLDNDGMPDVVIGNTGEAPLVLRHTGANAQNWIGLDLKPRIAGTVIRWSVKGTVRAKLLNAGGSYLSASDPRVLLGLGAASEPEWIEIQWPGHKMRRLPKLAARRYHQIEQ